MGNTLQMLINEVVPTILKSDLQTVLLSLKHVQIRHANFKIKTRCLMHSILL